MAVIAAAAATSAEPVIRHLGLAAYEPTWRAMQKFRAIPFQHAIGIMNTQLMFIDEETVARRIAFEQGHGPFDSKNATDERAGQKGNDAKMSNEKSDVMFPPRPARESGDSEISSQ